MKKILSFAMGVIALSMMATACTGNKATDAVASDSDSIVVDSVAQVDSVGLDVDSVEVVAE